MHRLKADAMSKSSPSFQALRQTWQTQWSGMSASEQRLITIAAWLAGLTLLVMVGVRPAWRTLQQTPPQLREVDAQLSDMRLLAQETQALRQRPPVPPAQAEASLKAATDRLGEAAQLSRQGERVTVAFKGVSGEALAAWLEEVRAGARAKPLEAALQQGEGGRYQGSITLALGAGGGEL